MSKFRKKPVVIEAQQFTGRNGDELEKWIRDGGTYCSYDGISVYIQTLEGMHRADKDDWIIQGVKGEFYPCKPDIFAATYEPAE